MTIEIVRFGVGNRRPQGPPGTVGLTGTPISSDARGLVAELAFARGGRIEPHSNPNTTWFLVVEGGGWVSVGDETARVAAGEAVLWPPDVIHGAWTEHGEMRAFVVEFATVAGPGGPGVIEGSATPLLGASVDRGEGSLHEDARLAGTYDPSEGEPR
jgi:quercetin dioxygenase-like cupin family protein